VTSSIALGTNHGCVLRSTGDVFCWGANSFRQAAPAATNLSVPIDSLFNSQPIMVGSEALSASELAAGGNISCARRVLGDIVCWGDNASGTVNGAPGTAGTVATNTITLSGTARTARNIAVGTDHLCAVLDNGVIACRGASSSNRLGATPGSPGEWVQVPGLTNVVAVTAGDRHTCALLAEGTVACWGEYTGTAVGSTPTAVDSDVIDVVAGERHTCALHSDHSVWCWGSNASGQFGAGSSAPTTSATPRLATALTGEFATAITAGGAHTCAIFTDNSTRCWGSNSSGQTGLPFTTTSTNVVTATVDVNTSVPARNARSIDAGGEFTCMTARNDGTIGDGVVRCWGNNTHAQLGNPSFPAPTNSEIAVGSFTPDWQCSFFSAWTSPHGGPLLDSGHKHTCMFVEVTGCAVPYSRGVHCFGDNTFGQLGNGTTSTPSGVIAEVSGFSVAVTSLSSGGDHTCVADVLGRVFCWGRNDHGQSGGSSPSPVTTPVQVTLEGGSAARAIAVTTGTDFSCALMATGEVQCWGDHSLGQLGRTLPWTTGSTPPSTLPSGWNSGFNATGERVRCGSCSTTPFLTRVTQISAGSAAVCARLSNGRIRCWGRNPRATNPSGSPPPSRTGATENTRIFGCGSDPRFCGCGISSLDACMSGESVIPNSQITLGVLPHAGRLNANFTSHIAPGGTSYVGPGCNDSANEDPIVSVSVHNDGGCVLTAVGTVFCWGSSANGRRGDGALSGMTQLLGLLQALNSEDAPQGTLANIVAVNGGDETKCALRIDGRVFCWGANSLRQVSGTLTPDQPRAVRVITSISGPTLLKDAISVTAGREQSCAMSEGWVRCWGARTGNTIFTAGPSAVPLSTP